MHDPVKGRLEDYLRDGSGRFPDVEEHLRNCNDCRKELDHMRAQSDLFRTLRIPAGVEPAPGFYARVMSRVETQARPSVWSLFGESLFAKRLSYASATFLVLLGTYLISSSELEEPVSASAPEVILAGEEAPQPVSMDPRDRELILVNLATWGEGPTSQTVGYNQDFQ